MIQRLDQAGLSVAVCSLKQRDEQFAAILKNYGPPPLWRRPQTLATLVRVVLEQQVSLKSADAIFKRIQTRLGRVTAQNIHSLGQSGLRKLGVTRQKARYLVGLAQAEQAGELRLASLRFKRDAEVRDQLMALLGVGEWTANVYLLMALGRPDIWPSGDLALLIALQKVYNMKQRPSPEAGHDYASRWSPFRSVAARMLWHWYLNQASSRNVAGI